MSSRGADVEKQTYRFAWQGIEIEVSYEPAGIGGFAHLEIRSLKPKAAPLPITGTGYRSHSHPAGTVEASGGDVVTQVTAWLDEEAAKPHWKRHVEAPRQGKLF
jgi:hypothetical protein